MEYAGDDEYYDAAGWQMSGVPRSALLVAQTNYADSRRPLAAAGKASRRMHTKLESLGFQGGVRSLEDAPRRPVVDAVKAIRDRLRASGRPEVVVFYFNGRARDEDGSIKLCTVDGDAVDLEVEVIRPLDLYGQGSTFVLLLDCCRDEEDSHLFASDLDASQALIDSAQSVIQAAVNSRKNHFALALSCDTAKRSAGNQDGDGAFANALLKNMHKRVSVGDMLTLVAVALSKAGSTGAMAWTFSVSADCQFTLSWDGAAPGGGYGGGYGADDRGSDGLGHGSVGPPPLAASVANAADAAAAGMAGMTLYPEQPRTPPGAGPTGVPGRGAGPAGAGGGGGAGHSVTLYPSSGGGYGGSGGAAARRGSASGAGAAYGATVAASRSPPPARASASGAAKATPLRTSNAGGGGGGGGGGAPAQLVRVVRDGAWPDAWLSEQRSKGYIVSHLAVMCSGTAAAAAAPRYGAALTRRAAPPSGISALVLTRMHTANAGRRHPGAGALVQEVKQLSDFTSLAMLSSDFQHYTMVSMSKVQLGPEGLCTSVCSSADAEFLVKQANEPGCVVLSLTPDLTSCTAADGRDALGCMAFRFNRPESGPAQHMIISDPGTGFPAAQVDRHMRTRGSLVRAAAYMADVRQWLVSVDYVAGAGAIAEQRVVLGRAGETPDGGEVQQLLAQGFKVTCVACGPGEWVTVLVRPLVPVAANIVVGGGLNQRGVTMMLNPQASAAWLSAGVYRSVSDLSIFDLQSTQHQVVVASVSQEWPQDQLNSLRQQGYLLTAIHPISARLTAGRSDMDLLVFTKASGVAAANVWSAWRFVKADAKSFQDLAAETQGPRATTTVAGASTYGCEGTEWVVLVHGRRCSTWESTWLVVVPMDEAADKFVSMPGQVVAMSATNGHVLLSGARGLSWGAGKVCILSSDRDVVQYIKELHTEGYTLTCATYSEPDRKWLLAASMMTGELAREGPKQAAFMAYGWEGARCTVQDMMRSGFYLSLLVNGPGGSLLVVMTSTPLMPAARA